MRVIDINFKININSDISLVLAFKLRDSFNDQILENIDVDFFIDNQLIKPIKKSDGCYVIIDDQVKVFNLKILANHYFERNVFIDLNKIKNNDRYIEIYLIPDYKYQKPPTKFHIEGVSDPDTEIWATKLSNRTNIRFIDFVKKDSLLKVSNPANESLLGKLMAVVDLEDNKFQSFFIKNQLLDGDLNSHYEIDSEIDKKYKISSPIQKAYITKSGVNGHYKLYLSNDNLDDEKYIILYYKNKKKFFKIIDNVN